MVIPPCSFIDLKPSYILTHISFGLSTNVFSSNLHHVGFTLTPTYSPQGRGIRGWYESYLILYRNFQICFGKFWAIMFLMNFPESKSAALRMSKFGHLQKAAEDFRYLLNRGYPRKVTLELVGNRYGLTFDERHLLHRGVFSSKDSQSRQKKRISIKEIRNQDLAIDGHNVIITIEAGLSGRPLVLSDDGFVRDISGLSGSFKKTETTENAIQLITDAIKQIKPRQTLFLLDAPISKSGKLAEEIRNRLKQANLPGDAMAIKVPEKILFGFPGIVATSDTAIIDRPKKVLDLAAYILTKKIGSKTFLKWKK